MTSPDSSGRLFVGAPLKDCISELKRLHVNSARFLEDPPCVRSVPAVGKRSACSDDEEDVDISLRRKSSRGQNLILKNTARLLHSYRSRLEELSRIAEEKRGKKQRLNSDVLSASADTIGLPFSDLSFLQSLPPRVLIKASVALNYLDVNGSWAELYQATRESFLRARLGVINLFPFAAQFCYDSLDILLTHGAAELTNFREVREGKTCSVDYLCWMSGEPEKVINAVQIAIRPYDETQIQMTCTPLPHFLVDGTVNVPASCKCVVGYPTALPDVSLSRPSADVAAPMSTSITTVSEHAVAPSPASPASDLTSEREPELRYLRLWQPADLQALANRLESSPSDTSSGVESLASPSVAFDSNQVRSCQTGPPVPSPAHSLPTQSAGHTFSVCARSTSLPSVGYDDMFTDPLTSPTPPSLSSGGYLDCETDPFAAHHQSSGIPSLPLLPLPPHSETASNSLPRIATPRSSAARLSSQSHAQPSVKIEPGLGPMSADAQGLMYVSHAGPQAQNSAVGCIPDHAFSLQPQPSSFGGCGEGVRSGLAPSLWSSAYFELESSPPVHFPDSMSAPAHSNGAARSSAAPVASDITRGYMLHMQASSALLRGLQWDSRSSPIGSAGPNGLTESMDHAVKMQF